MTEERLEEIKIKTNNTTEPMLYVPYSDINWLIKRAEQVQELEEENKKLKSISQAKSEEMNGLLEHFDTSWEEIFDE